VSVSETPMANLTMRKADIIAAAIVLIPGAPLGLMTEYVQVLAGVLLPSCCFQGRC